MCIKVYELDSAHFLSATALAWQSCLKKTGVEPDMLLMVEKGIRGKICHAKLRHTKSSNKYIKDYNKDEEESRIIQNLIIIQKNGFQKTY